jgi:hypothetical protein
VPCGTGWDPGIQRGFSGKTGEIQIKSGVKLTVTVKRKRGQSEQK